MENSSAVDHLIGGLSGASAGEAPRNREEPSRPLGRAAHRRTQSPHGQRRRARKRDERVMCVG